MPEAGNGSVRGLGVVRRLPRVARDDDAFRDLGRVREEIGRVLLDPFVRELHRLIGSGLVLAHTEGSHETVTCIDPVVRDEARHLFELGHEAVANEARRFVVVVDAFVTANRCIHWLPLCSPTWNSKTISPGPTHR